jgi:hypothetical protein
LKGWWSPPVSRSSSPRCDASTPHGRPSHDANDRSSSCNDASGTCSWNEAMHGKPHANGAWASNDETSSLSLDGAHSTRNDSIRQIRIEARPLSVSFILLALLHQGSLCCDSGCFPTAWQGRLAPLSYQENSFGREERDKKATVFICIVKYENEIISSFS